MMAQLTSACPALICASAASRSLTCFSRLANMVRKWPAAASNFCGESSCTPTWWVSVCTAKQFGARMWTALATLWVRGPHASHLMLAALLNSALEKKVVEDEQVPLLALRHYIARHRLHIIPSDVIYHRVHAVPHTFVDLPIAASPQKLARKALELTW
eukprot:Colp12_sorted_trinity150504_noHs@5670